MNSKYYVYAYYDPRNNQIFYIGKGCNNRWKDHLKETKEKTDNILKWRKINSIREDGFEPIISKLHENLEENNAYDVESKLIKTYGKIGEGGLLTNCCVDRRPPKQTGPKSELQKKKMSESYWNRVSQPGYIHPSKGKICSEAERESSRQANLGRKHTEEHRRKNSESKKQLLSNKINHPLYGKHHSESTKQKISNTKKGKLNDLLHLQDYKQNQQ